MKIRLFWKILLIFWLICLITFEVIRGTFSLHLSPGAKNNLIYRTAITQMTAAVSVIENVGIEAFWDTYRNWPERDKLLFSIKPMSTFHYDYTPNGILKRIASAPDGNQYIIRYDIQRANTDPLFVLFHIPLSLVLCWIVGGLIFSSFLAWRLSHPINQLKSAFSRVAAGDLSVRLNSPKIARRDELSTLAQNFDDMVTQLDILISTREGLMHDVSHELRTPLTRLQLAIGLAHQNPANTTSALQRIELEAHRLERMISEILAFSRSGFAHKDSDDYFDFIELLRVIIADVNYEAEQAGIAVEFINLINEKTGHTIIHGNAEMVRRAVENILRNAVRFSPSQHKVKVLVKSAQGQIILRIADDGPGVEESKLSSIFEPFFRIPSATAGKGYGLGLAIAQKVATNHGGTIFAENAQTGGLIVTLTLPCSEWQMD